jgi:hypothetical protein
MLFLMDMMKIISAIRITPRADDELTKLSSGNWNWDKWLKANKVRLDWTRAT